MALYRGVNLASREITVFKSTMQGNHGEVGGSYLIRWVPSSQTKLIEYAMEKWTHPSEKKWTIKRTKYDYIGVIRSGQVMSDFFDQKKYNVPNGIGMLFSLEFPTKIEMRGEVFEDVEVRGGVQTHFIAGSSNLEFRSGGKRQRSVSKTAQVDQSEKTVEPVNRDIECIEKDIKDMMMYLKGKGVDQRSVDNMLERSKLIFRGFKQ